MTTTEIVSEIERRVTERLQACAARQAADPTGASQEYWNGCCEALREVLEDIIPEVAEMCSAQEEAR